MVTGLSAGFGNQIGKSFVVNASPLEAFGDESSIIDSHLIAVGLRKPKSVGAFSNLNTGLVVVGFNNEAVIEVSVSAVLLGRKNLNFITDEEFQLCSLRGKRGGYLPSNSRSLNSPSKVA